MAKRISHKNVGEVFDLRFEGEYGLPEKWQLMSFNGVQNALETCTATFQRVSLKPGEYGQTFQAYRNKGRWVYGSSADVLRSV
jgi:hypothetical protein